MNRPMNQNGKERRDHMPLTVTSPDRTVKQQVASHCQSGSQVAANLTVTADLAASLNCETLE